MPPREVVVNVTDKGDYVVIGQTLDEPALAGFLHDVSIKNPGTQTVQIRADDRVPFRYPARVMGLCEMEKLGHYCTVMEEEHWPTMNAPAWPVDIAWWLADRDHRDRPGGRGGLVLPPGCASPLARARLFSGRGGDPRLSGRRQLLRLSRPRGGPANPKAVPPHRRQRARRRWRACGGCSSLRQSPSSRLPI